MGLNTVLMGLHKYIQKNKKKLAIVVFLGYRAI